MNLANAYDLASSTAAATTVVNIQKRQNLVTLKLVKSLQYNTNYCD